MNIKKELMKLLPILEEKLITNEDTVQLILGNCSYNVYSEYDEILLDADCNILIHLEELIDDEDNEIVNALKIISIFKDEQIVVDIEISAIINTHINLNDMNIYMGQFSLNGDFEMADIETLKIKSIKPV